MLKPFTELEFLLLLNGASTIPVDEWRAHTAFTGGEFPRIEEWFWSCVESFSQSERAGLLQFATGCSTLPPEGFAGLKGLDANSSSNFTVAVGRGLDGKCLCSTRGRFTRVRSTRGAPRGRCAPRVVLYWGAFHWSRFARGRVALVLMLTCAQ